MRVRTLLPLEIERAVRPAGTELDVSDEDGAVLVAEGRAEEVHEPALDAPATDSPVASPDHEEA